MYLMWLIYALFALAGIALVLSVVFMMKDGGKGTRNVKALTFRISVCVILFVILMIAIGTGHLVPSNSPFPHVRNPAQQEPDTTQ